MNPCIREQTVIQSFVPDLGTGSAIQALLFSMSLSLFEGFPGGSDGKVSACDLGDLGLIPGLGRSNGEGNCNPLQYSGLENSLDGGAW